MATVAIGRLTLMKMTERNSIYSHNGLYKSKRMPFGLMTAPATFECAIYIVHSSVWFQCALTYLDDIVIYSPTLDEHLRDLSRVLKLLKDAGVSIKRAKCSFAAVQVKYLGLKVSHAGVEVDDDKIASVRHALAPKPKTGLRRLLGMTGFYRKFIPTYSNVAAPSRNISRATGMISLSWTPKRSRLIKD
jgi:hypothetical protein